MVHKNNLRPDNLIIATAAPLDCHPILSTRRYSPPSPPFINHAFLGTDTLWCGPYDLQTKKDYHCSSLMRQLPSATRNEADGTGADL